nr:hypothetical protein [Sphingomonas sp. CFBP 13720]
MGFDDVEDRLVEALRTCQRYADRERGWQRIRSAWPEISRDVFAGDYDARGGEGTSSDVALRSAAMTRQDVAEMEEAFGWLDAIDPADRKLIGLAIGQLARGRREVPWVKLLPAMDLERGSEGLRMRYGRAITSICNRVNGGNPQRNVSTG